MEEKKTCRWDLRVTPSMDEQVQAAAAELEVSRNQFIEDAVKAHLEQISPQTTTPTTTKKK